MIISLIIIILLILAFRHGIRKGLVLPILNFIGYILVLFISLHFATSFGDFLATRLPDLGGSTSTSILGIANISISQLIYRVLAFWIIILAGGIVFRFVARVINGVFKLPLLSQLNSLIGGILSLVVMYIAIFFGVLILSTGPTESIKASVTSAPVANFILEKTPLFSQALASN
ncbi:CvpA family protein [Ligilactobacillus sp. WILCCON 0076]|uniref:CvpA family protein n=1 Tax=Ligilactobacillus ubinensis TaxID=2876789 RepID=A0A9X2FHV9_9LACO|nr:CvpA family protein [Ligilactobacillus ubinensis]MCP0885985.1 CvpA family protein [Ligilactobacillus ubinensis]